MSSLIAIGIGFSFGSSSSIGSVYYLFISLPIRVVLVFPIITPSGLHIGIILKTNLFLSSSATLDLDTRKLIKPWTIQLEAVSPGWIRAWRNTIYFVFCQSLSSKLVIVSRGTSTPPNDLQSTDSYRYLPLGFFLGFESSSKLIFANSSWFFCS